MTLMQLAGIAHSYRSKYRIMLIFRAFVDESGDFDDPKLHFSGMAGFIAPEKNWEGVAAKWNAVLAKWGISGPLHMKLFAHSLPPFERFKTDEHGRRAFFNELLDVIKSTRATPFGAIVSTEAFKGLTDTQKQSFGGDPYF